MAQTPKIRTYLVLCDENDVDLVEHTLRGLASNPSARQPDHLQAFETRPLPVRRRGPLADNPHLGDPA